jgi:CarboxypepD_reg-like domain
MYLKKQIISFFVLLIISTSLFAQLTITGVVIDAKNKDALAGANVFINNTSYKTITNAEGKFVFANLNIQKGELIVNALGYKHAVTNVDNKIEKVLTITLEPQAKELDAVLIRSYEKNGYKKWGKLFTDVFIGTTHEAFDCTIDNSKALKFYYDKKTQTLSVSANEPLKIINKALGYQIDYTLEDFEYNTKTNILFYSGYPVFTEMQKGKRKMQQWKEKRNDCYRGSIMHFMRTLYRNKFVEEGFVVQKANKVLNEKKAAYKKELKKNISAQANGVITISGEMNNNGEDIMSQPDSIYQIISQVLPADSFAFAIDSVTAGMYFEKHLIVSYKKQDLNATVSSFVRLLYDESLSIFQNGSYYNAMNFFTERYWAENEKISRMLPFNFIYNSNLKE